MDDGGEVLFDRVDEEQWYETTTSSSSSSGEVERRPSLLYCGANQALTCAHLPRADVAVSCSSRLPQKHISGAGQCSRLPQL